MVIKGNYSYRGENAYLVAPEGSKSAKKGFLSLSLSLSIYLSIYLCELASSYVSYTNNPGDTIT